MVDIERKVKNAIGEQLGIKEEKITMDSYIVDDLGADSLDTVELFMAIEDLFGIDIPDEDADKLGSGKITIYLPALVLCIPN
ncbi:hypothetical protein N7468_005026 [Penicillium chermesinum]|uniref:Acyl carrier protein n=1 Tax=Penicillium chermesinum TaxID=63820 RepID=A0A9W9NYP2_9EURO|nr:uncharacterized protein N7468_005026 [Penicillium chermesinum]KAJ5232070.1 hypothetical protein N7468_005026 [Penicillium chermesinum]KAJ6171736.1 hypothetical protein N7470_000803 [Penicillium chermesinum]